MKIVIKSKYNKSSNLELELIETQPSYIKFDSSDDGAIYNNLEYSFDIVSDEIISNIKVYINNKEEKSHIINSKIYFLDDNNSLVDFKRVFNNYYGYAFIAIEYINSSGEKFRVYTNWIDVYVKNDYITSLIKPMIKYIYNNSSKYLYKDNSNILDYSSVISSKNRNMHTQLAILEKIVLVYTENLKFFKNYVHYESIESAVVDDFEKLNMIKGDTIQFIVSNPQYLRQTQIMTGIKYNKTNLIPIKTLINKNVISHNVYENKIILGFLKSICLIISDNIKILSKKTINNNNNNNKEYISSGFCLHEFVISNINLYLDRLYELKKQFLELYLLYKKVLNCDEIIINKIPKPTMNFIKVKHYQKIYVVIKEWFESGNYDFTIENMILSFNNASQIYEYYILLNINEFLIQNKFKLTNSLKTVYSTSKNSLYTNTEFENTFIFNKNDVQVTVFYQPVISSKKKYYNHLLGLFKNNNISYYEGNSDYHTSYYYTPDYVIKINKNNKNKYIILDAKFSSVNTVLKYSFSKIAYKYSFSISTNDDDDEIVKVWMINGQNDFNENENCIYNLYDSEFKERNAEIKPSMKILTFNPNIEANINYNNLLELFNDIE